MLLPHSAHPRGVSVSPYSSRGRIMLPKGRHARPAEKLMQARERSPRMPLGLRKALLVPFGLGGWCWCHSDLIGEQLLARLRLPRYGRGWADERGVVPLESVVHAVPVPESSVVRPWATCHARASSSFSIPPIPVAFCERHARPAGSGGIPVAFRGTPRAARGKAHASA